MKLQLRNIGKIKSADILLNGLTVIAGVNDSGKSTVGKSLFAAVKALAKTINYNDKLREGSIRNDIRSVYKRLNGLNARRTNAIELPEELFPRMQGRFSELLRQEEDIRSFFEKRCRFIESLEISPRQKTLILQDMENVEAQMTEDINPSGILKREFQSLVEAEFFYEICTKNADGKSSIELIDEDRLMLVEIEADKVKKSAVGSDTDTLFQDATYIESPLYIHLMDVLPMSDTVVPYHIKDMAQKINAAKYIQLPSGKSVEGLMDMDKITGGHFVYDAKKRGLFWKKGGVEYSPTNVASGIKAFGVMQLLLETLAFDQNKVLIWDEPENHLHPEWQIAFAQLLVELANKGFPIVVSSHSPYFIQGIRYFASKESIRKYTNYYLTEDTGDGLIELQEVTHDLNRLFAKLAQPLNRIMNIEEQKE